jgi:hypothetical protein
VVAREFYAEGVVAVMSSVPQVDGRLRVGTIVGDTVEDPDVELSRLLRGLRNALAMEAAGIMLLCGLWQLIRILH